MGRSIHCVWSVCVHVSLPSIRSPPPSLDWVGLGALESEKADRLTAGPRGPKFLKICLLFHTLLPFPSALCPSLCLRVLSLSPLSSLPLASFISLLSLALFPRLSIMPPPLLIPTLRFPSL